MKSAHKKLNEMRHLDPLPDMDDVQFKLWVELLEKRTGTVLPPERKSFLVTNIGLRMREIECSSYKEYFGMIAGVNGLQEWNTLVDRITVHETRFFRHPLSLELIEEYVINKKPDPENGQLSVQVWSVACSTGEEAYSLAMIVDQAFKAGGKTSYFGVTATDISPASLQTGREGAYSERRINSLDASMRDKYFSRTEDNKYKVRDYLRKRVCFARKNVLDIAGEPVSEMDIIYCQNLLIYFDRSTRIDIVNNLARHLLPGGMLILGSGEVLNINHPQLEKIAHSRVLAFRRKIEVQN
ncbi:MAG TPA: protein-glutamate O-methyltransferase CheR [Gammaproteobacteria bacterium]|nr:protein-glutamate O-methyltransferase CheR [Gammaproteobacteria bacterium]